MAIAKRAGSAARKSTAPPLVAVMSRFSYSTQSGSKAQPSTGGATPSPKWWIASHSVVNGGSTKGATGSAHGAPTSSSPSPSVRAAARTEIRLMDTPGGDASRASGRARSNAERQDFPAESRGTRMGGAGEWSAGSLGTHEAALRQVDLPITRTARQPVAAPSRGVGRPLVRRGEEAKPLQVEALERGDPEPRPAHELLDVAVQVAAARDLPPDRVHPLLPRPHAVFRSEPMLDEQHPAGRCKYAPHLAQRAERIGNTAQHPRDDDGVDRAIVERQLLRGALQQLDRKREAVRLRARHCGELRQRLDGDERGHVAGVVGQIQARADADLEDPSARPRYQ